MAKQFAQKLKPMYVLEILRKHTDEEHPITANEICEKLAEYGIPAERKSVYGDISALEEFGYDIIKSSYPKGWFLGSREFELPEIYLLSDAVNAAKFISPKKTAELKKKLNSFLSVTQGENQGKNVYFSNIGKCSNEEIFYNIDIISRAIFGKKKIEFKYSSRVLTKDRTLEYSIRQRKVSPYALVWHDDHYYLIGNYEKYDNLIHLRLDRIRNAKILDQNARRYSEVSEYKEFFDISDYVSKLFGMYGGKLSQVELCCNKNIIEQVVDRFGENIFIKKVTDESFNFSTKAVLSEALVTWVMNYGEQIQVVEPQELCQRIKARAQEILKIYEK